MGNDNIWEQRGFVEIRPGVFERPVKKSERKNPPVSSEPVSSGAQLQEHKKVRKERAAVHAKGNKGKDAGDHIKTKTTLLLNFRLTNNRTHDLDGMGAALCDCLRHSEVITDDSTRYVQRIVCRYEKANKPGVDIVVIDYE